MLLGWVWRIFVFLEKLVSVRIVVFRRFINNWEV